MNGTVDAINMGFRPMMLMNRIPSKGPGTAPVNVKDVAKAKSSFDM